MKPPGLLSQPVWSLLTAAVWLLLQPSIGIAQVIVAVVLGLTLPRALAAFLRWSGPGMTPVGVDRVAPVPDARPAVGGGRRLAIVLRLVAVVAWDIVVANLRVAAIVLWPGSRPQPAWIELPLVLRHPGGISVLASIVTMTPGTVSCVIDEAHHRLIIHALDAPDPAAVASEIHARYEAPLLELYR